MTNEDSKNVPEHWTQGAVRVPEVSRTGRDRQRIICNRITHGSKCEMMHKSQEAKSCEQLCEGRDLMLLYETCAHASTDRQRESMLTTYTCTDNDEL